MPRTQRLRRQRLAKHTHLMQPAVHHEVLVVIVIRANLQPCFRGINYRPALLGRLRHLFAIHEQPLRCAIVRTGKMIPAAVLKRRRRSQVGQLVAALGVQRETETAPTKPKQPALLIGAIVLQRSDDPPHCIALSTRTHASSVMSRLGISTEEISDVTSSREPFPVSCTCAGAGVSANVTERPSPSATASAPTTALTTFLQSIWREEPMTQHRFLSHGNTAAANHK